MSLLRTHGHPCARAVIASWSGRFVHGQPRTQLPAAVGPFVCLQVPARAGRVFGRVGQRLPDGLVGGALHGDRDVRGEPAGEFGVHPRIPPPRDQDPDPAQGRVLRIRHRTAGVLAQHPQDVAQFPQGLAPRTADELGRRGRYACARSPPPVRPAGAVRVYGAAPEGPHNRAPTPQEQQKTQ
ncbi:hypothetical protein GCM10007147_06840 [Nocardiopsis kunsanensis]|uniref:Uncharacterized protein n=1 Tax=Nocardiopsis kunsanensis TaxID=141693 RepID=A0A919CFI0_9ACTN|nr:hypothetical protein GCM10007147_06840 [Nocardiopsis kunsanensis]